MLRGRGDADGTFFPATYVAATHPFQAAIADLNHDGKPDLATTNFGGSVSVLLGQGGAAFSSPINTSVPSVLNLAIGDFNHDDIPGLATANYDDKSVSVLRGPGVPPTIEFDPSLFADPGQQTIALGGTQLQLSKDVSIIGPGQDKLAIGGNHASAVFWVDSGVIASIAGLTVENGSFALGGGVFNQGTLTIDNCTVSANTSSYIGAGIFNSGTLTLNDSIVSGNSMVGFCFGAGIFSNGTLTLNNSSVIGNVGSWAGGIYTSNRATLTDCLIADNTAGGDGSGQGGGILNYGSLTVANSTIRDNSAGEVGGGLINKGNATLTDTVITINSASAGGGLCNEGDLTLTNDTISHNLTSHSGGGFFNVRNATLTDTTVEENTAVENGGGIYNTGGSLTVSNLTVSDNSAGLLGSGFYMESGVLAGSGSFHVASNSLAFDGDGLKTLDGITIVNEDRVLWAGAGNIVAINGACFQNQAGAVFDIQNNQNFEDGHVGAAALFENAGTIVKSAGGGTTVVTVALQNTGTIDEQSGKIFIITGPIVHWISSASGAWENAANWQDDFGVHRLPGADDNVIIDAPGSITVSHSNGNDSVKRLISYEAINISGGSLSVASASVVDVLKVTGGDLLGMGSVQVSQFDWTLGRIGLGSLTLQAGGSGTIRDPSGGSFLKTLSTTLINEGYITWTGNGWKKLTFASGAVLDNHAGATFEVKDLGIITNLGLVIEGGSGAKFLNAGTMLQQDYAETFVGVRLENSGLVDLRHGTMLFQGGGAATGQGQFNGAAGTGLELDSMTLGSSSSVIAPSVTLVNTTVGGSYQASVATYLTNVAFTGTVTSLGDALTVSGDTRFQLAGSPTFALKNLTVTDASRLSGAVNFTVATKFVWRGASSTLGGGAGSVTVLATGTMEIGNANNAQSSAQVNDGRANLDGWTIINQGQAKWYDVVLMVGSNGAEFRNENTFEIGMTGIDVEIRGLKFINAGPDSRLVKKVFESSVLFRGGAFSNDGTVEVQARSLEIDSDQLDAQHKRFQSSGSFVAAAGTSLGLGNMELTGTSSVTGTDMTLTNMTVGGSYQATVATHVYARVVFQGTVAGFGKALFVGDRSSSAEMIYLANGPASFQLETFGIHGDVKGLPSLTVGAFDWTHGRLGVTGSVTLLPGGAGTIRDPAPKPSPPPSSTTARSPGPGVGLMAAAFFATNPSTPSSSPGRRPRPSTASPSKTMAGRFGKVTATSSPLTGQCSITGPPASSKSTTTRCSITATSARCRFSTTAAPRD